MHQIPTWNWMKHFRYDWYLITSHNFDQFAHFVCITFWQVIWTQWDKILYEMGMRQCIQKYKSYSRMDLNPFCQTWISNCIRYISILLKMTKLVKNIKKNCIYWQIQWTRYLSSFNQSKHSYFFHYLPIDHL